MLKIFFILILIFNVNISFSDTKETYKQLSIFNEVYNRVKNQYVEEVTDKELIEKALNGMLQALDPHSSFMSEEIYKEMQMDTSGSFGGLGIEITTDKGFIKVVSPIDDTPAYKAGILAGDYITPKLVGGTEGLMIANMIQVQFSKANNAPLAAALSVSSLMIVAFISIVFVLINRKYLRRY